MNLNKYLIIGLVLIMGLMMTLLLYKTNENLETQEKSFHILIATIGKDGIFRILKSLKTQLRENDYLTIVFDGPNWPNVQEVIEYTKDFKCKVSIIVEEINLGHWGHAIRNKHKNLKGDYVFHVDDDDDITPDCMESLRKHCIDTNKVYVFKMQLDPETIYWVDDKKIVANQIGTPMGIIPIEINKKSEFGYFYGGDFAFYKTLEDQNIPFEFVDKLTYKVKPSS